MCGIFGIVDRLGNSADLTILSALAEGLRHRGPDSGDGFTSDHASIGMQRLAIIDTEGGRQPLWNERRTVAVVANGEIYNFVELRRELERRGHRFQTGSDCEVIVHSYEEYGAEFLSRLRGMFAFALVDFEARRVWIARDRLGEKPLYLVETPDRIVFASELQALVGAGVVPLVLDDIAVRDYFMWGFVPEPRSPLVGSRKLPAAHVLEISLDTWRVREHCWWRPSDAPAVDGDPGELLSQVLDDIGELTIRADVPVGIALSGGIDSSALAALACSHASHELHTFTVGYGGRDRRDESESAAAFASMLGTEHHRVVLEPPRVAADFPRMCQSRDEPIADIAGPAYLALMEAAHHAGVPVLLLGQGSDELFWGYSWAVDAVRANLRKRRLLAGAAGLGAYLRMERPPLSYSGLITWALDAGGFGSGLRAWRRDRHAPAGQAIFFDDLHSWTAAEKALGRVTTGDFRERVAAVRPESVFTSNELSNRPDLTVTDLVVSTYLLSNGINQADRLAMAQSVEVRLPFVDYRLVETVMGLRRNTEDWQLPPKAWLREALKSVLPQEIFDRPKRGFTPPWRLWSNAIFREHGEALIGGVLVETGVFRRLDSVPRPLDRLGRLAPLPMAALSLELWARGLRERQSASGLTRTTAPCSGWRRYGDIGGLEEREALI